MIQSCSPHLAIEVATDSFLRPGLVIKLCSPLFLWITSCICHQLQPKKNPVQFKMTKKDHFFKSSYIISTTRCRHCLKNVQCLTYTNLIWTYIKDAKCFDILYNNTVYDHDLEQYTWLTFTLRSRFWEQIQSWM